MLETEVIIVGGGPAGAAAALELKRNNREVIILDKAKFPRVKLCAGWITPKVFQLLNKKVEDYPYGILTFKKLHFDFGFLKIPFPTTQFSIRRFEFDNWLHEISNVETIQHKVEKIEEANGYYIIDGKFKGKYLIGAGGTHCPVYHQLFKEINPRALEDKIVAMEEEFPYNWQDERCLLWFGDLKFKGYSWYVPKANGFLNVGIGVTFYGQKYLGKNIRQLWNEFTQKLLSLGLVKDYSFEGKGHSYYLRQNVTNVRRGNAFIVGDAVGLATLDMGEGISAAIESGILAARSILFNTPYDLTQISKYSLNSLFFSKRFLKSLK